jgi:hypothetical protein
VSGKSRFHICVKENQPVERVCLFDVSQLTEIVKKLVVVYLIKDSFIDKVFLALFDNFHELASATEFVMNLRTVCLVKYAL